MANDAAPVPVRKNTRCRLKDTAAKIIDCISGATRGDAEKNLLDQILDFACSARLVAEELNETRPIRHGIPR